MSWYQDLIYLPMSFQLVFFCFLCFMFMCFAHVFNGLRVQLMYLFQIYYLVYLHMLGQWVGPPAGPTQVTKSLSCLHIPISYQIIQTLLILVWKLATTF